MMGVDQVRIHTITEEDFDRVVEIAGGTRIDQPGSADYRLNEAVVELKLVVEEAFDKQTHQKKLAKIFQKLVPGSPVVVIRPQMLNGPEARSYYRVVETGGPLTHDFTASWRRSRIRCCSPPPPAAVAQVLWRAKAGRSCCRWSAVVARSPKELLDLPPGSASLRA